jgi:hypothetical protein
MTRLLMITNEVRESTERGFRAEFEALEASGSLDAFETVAPGVLLRDGMPWGEVVSHVADLAARVQPTIVLVLSPKASPWTQDDVARALRPAPTAEIAYWEGDPWGRRHRPTPSMVPWLRAAGQVFTTALGEQYDTLREAGAQHVRFVPNTYCHVQFADAESTWTPPSPENRRRVVMVGNRAGRVPGVSSVPGARARWRMVTLASRRFGDDFCVHGRGWRGPSAVGPVAYAAQADALRAGGLSLNWDHYPRHVAYTSDRLPISLVAGRPHVTTRHPEMGWLPREESGLFLAGSPHEVVELADHLRGLPDDDRVDLGRAAHAWVKDRMSHRQAARFMLSESGGPAIALPDPWSQTATMGDGLRGSARSS